MFSLSFPPSLSDTPTLSSIPHQHQIGVFFLFGAGRLALVRSQPSKALTYYARAAQAQSQYRNLHHISWWESAVACLGLWRCVFLRVLFGTGMMGICAILILVLCRVADSRLWWGKLGGEATVGFYFPSCVCVFICLQFFPSLGYHHLGALSGPKRHIHMAKQHA